MSPAMEKYMKVPHRIQARYGVTVQTFTTMLANNMQTWLVYFGDEKMLRNSAGWWFFQPTKNDGVSWNEISN